jgi:hypothetical protein
MEGAMAEGTSRGFGGRSEVMSLEIIDLQPSDTPDYMIPAWLGCISWVSKSPQIIEMYCQATGSTYQPARSPIEAMIDQATGRGESEVRKFVLWVNENLWGDVGVKS